MDDSRRPLSTISECNAIKQRVLCCHRRLGRNRADHVRRGSFAAPYRRRPLLREAVMIAKFDLEVRYDARGAPAFFIKKGGVDLTSRWTREDADVALASLRASPDGSFLQSWNMPTSLNGILVSLLARIRPTPVEPVVQAGIVVHALR